MNVETVEADNAGITRAADLVKRGEVVAFPTETLYGLAVAATDSGALERLAGIKGRGPGQPFPLIIGDEVMLSDLVARIPAAARQLIEAHWPGPLTLVLPARPGLPQQLVGPDGGVGLRISSDPVARALVRQCGCPITATSANRGGEAPATSARKAGLPGVALVLDDGPRQAQASTVVAVLDSPVVLRQGVIKVEVS